MNLGRISLCISIIILIIYSIVFPLQSLAESMVYISFLEKGTLVIAVPSNEGVVVCADKRVYYIDKDVTHDTKTKIIQIGSHGLFASIGVLSFIRSGEFASTRFEVDKIVENYFQDRDIRRFKDEQWTDFCQYLEKFFVADTYTQIQTDASDKPFLQVAFFYLNTSNSFNRTIVQLLKRKEELPLSKLGVQVTFKTDLDQMTKTSIKCLGEASLIKEIISGDDKRFDEIRRNPIVLKAFGAQAITSGQFTPQEAKELASYLIESTSKRANLVQDFKGHVSPTCDCAIINYRHGFRWFEKRNKN